MRTKDLPFGICRTYFFNACDRRTRKNKRNCFVAYAGAGKTYQSKRFPIDTHGLYLALLLAADWRFQRGPLDQRASDISRCANRFNKFKSKIAGTLKIKSNVSLH